MARSKHQPDSGDDDPGRFVTSDNDATGRPPFREPRWKLAGIDQEGAHHVLQTDDDIIYVVNGTTLEHTQPVNDWREGLTIDRWRDYVDDTRGWDEFFLQIIDLTTTIHGDGR